MHLAPVGLRRTQNLGQFPTWTLHLVATGFMCISSSRPSLSKTPNTNRLENMMSTTIVGLYESADAAQKAVQALVTAGSQRKDIDVLGGAGSADTITRKLVDHGFEKAEAQRYAA